MQYEIRWADKAANLRLWEERIAALSGKADVALLPEMCTTGFCTDHPELAEESDGETIHRLQAAAEQAGVMVVGSFIAKADAPDAQAGSPGLVNRGFMLRPNMPPVFIDKRHLYKHGGEDRFFRAGNDRTVVEWQGVRFRYIICYDLRFPVWSRSTPTEPYDVLLVSANWPAIRIQYWDALVAARATENQCYIAAVNCVGTDGMGLEYNGHSVAYDSRLRPIVEWQDGEEGTRIAEFNMAQLAHFREVLPLWQDADTFEIKE